MTTITLTAGGFAALARVQTDGMKYTQRRNALAKALGYANADAIAAAFKAEAAPPADSHTELRDTQDALRQVAGRMTQNLSLYDESLAQTSPEKKGAVFTQVKSVATDETDISLCRAYAGVPHEFQSKHLIRQYLVSAGVYEPKGDEKTTATLRVLHRIMLWKLFRNRDPLVSPWGYAEYQAVRDGTQNKHLVTSYDSYWLKKQEERLWEQIVSVQKMFDAVERITSGSAPVTVFPWILQVPRISDCGNLDDLMSPELLRLVWMMDFEIAHATEAAMSGEQYLSDAPTLFSEACAEMSKAFVKSRDEEHIFFAK